MNTQTTWRPAIVQTVDSASLLPTIIVAYALALIVYLPIEPSAIGWLPSTAFWVLRLLPDALVGVLALAVVLFGDRWARTSPVRILWAVGAVCLILVAANAARGFSVIDSVNAIRVTVRYVALGLLVWWALIGRASAGPLVIGAVLIAGAIQVIISAAEILVHIAGSVGTGTLDPATLFFVDGTLGRYDRLGLLVMSVVLALIATDDRLGRMRAGLLVSCMVLLYLTTSRQAMIGLAVASGLLLIFPRTPVRTRAITLVVVALSLVFVLAVPLRAPPPATTADPDAIVLPSLRDPSRPTVQKPEVELSVDPLVNFRLYYNLTLAPWAAATEPVLGFGPLAHVAEVPDPRIEAKVEATGMSWDYARLFMNDSNYGSLIVQFGIVAPALLLLLLLVITSRIAFAATRPRGGFARFAALNAIAILVAAWFGPTFEIRMTSVILWVALMAAMAVDPAMNPGTAEVGAEGDDPASAIAPQTENRASAR